MNFSTGDKIIDNEDSTQYDEDEKIQQDMEFNRP